MPPFGMSSNGSMGFELLVGDAAGPREMSPPWIMKPGINRWKGVLLYAPLAQRAMKFWWEVGGWLVGLCWGRKRNEEYGLYGGED